MWQGEYLRCATSKWACSSQLPNFTKNKVNLCTTDWRSLKKKKLKTKIALDLASFASAFPN